MNAPPFYDQPFYTFPERLEMTLEAMPEGTPVTNGEMAWKMVQRLNAGKATINGYMLRLEREGKIKRLRRGLYVRGYV